MQKRLRPKINFANVVSCLALFIALGGSAYAVKQLPKNSVGTKQLKKNSVTKQKVRKNAITTPKIVNNAVTGAKIKEATLGTVPTASQAGFAGNAGNAGTLGGLPPSAFQSRITGTCGAEESVTSVTSEGSVNCTPDLNAIVASDRGTFTASIAESCTHEPGGEVTINVPSDGTVVITANAWLRTEHTNGVADFIYLYIGTTNTDCPAGEEGFATVHTIPAGMPTFEDTHITVPVSRVVDVSAGSHTFYFNARREGSDVQDFFYSGMTAVFYPS